MPKNTPEKSSRRLERQPDVLESYRLSDGINKTVERLEEKVAKAEGQEKIDAKLALQKVKLFKERLIKLGKKITQGGLIEDEKKKVLLEIGDVVTNLRVILYRLDIPEETISSFKESSFGYNKKAIDTLLDNNLGFESEEARKNFYKPLDEIVKAREELANIYWENGSSDYSHRAYLDALSGDLNACGDYYIKCSLIPDGKDPKFDELKLRVKATTHYVYDKLPPPEAATTFLYRRIEEAKKYVSIMRDVDTVGESSAQAVALFDIIVDKRDVQSYSETLKTLADNSNVSYKNIERTGFLNKPCQDLPTGLLPSQDFALSSYDATLLKANNERLAKLAEHMKEARFSRFLKIIGDLKIGNVDEKNIPTESLVSAYKEIDSLYKGSFRELNSALDNEAPYAPPVLKKIKDTLFAIKEELAARETIKMDHGKLDDLAKKYPQYVTIEKEGRSVVVKFTLAYYAIKEKDEKARTKKEREIIVDIDSTVHLFNADYKVVAEKVMENIESNETLKIAYRAFRALQEEENFVKAKRLYLEFLKKAEGDDSIEATLLAEARSILKNIAIQEVNTISGRIDTILTSLVYNIDKSQRLWGLTKVQAQVLKNYFYAQRNALSIASEILRCNENSVVTVEAALEHVKIASGKNKGQFSSHLEGLGIKNGSKLFEAFFAGKTMSNPLTYFNGMKLPSSVSQFADVITDYMGTEAKAENLEERRAVWFGQVQKFTDANLYFASAQFYKMYFHDLIKKYSVGKYEWETFSKNIRENGGFMHDEFRKRYKKNFDFAREREHRHPLPGEIEQIEASIITQLHEEALFKHITETIEERQKERLVSDPESERWLKFHSAHFQHIDRSWYEVWKMNSQEVDEFLSQLIITAPFLLAGGALAQTAGRATLTAIATRTLGARAAAELAKMSLKQIIVNFGGKRLALALASKGIAFGVESAVFSESMLFGSAFASQDIKVLGDLEAHGKSFCHSVATLGVVKGVSAGLKAARIPENMLTKFTLYPVVDTISLSGLEYAFAGGDVDMAASLRNNFVTCLGLRASHSIAGKVSSAVSQEGRARDYRTSEITGAVRSVEGQRPLTAHEVAELDSYSMGGREAWDVPDSPVTKGMTPDIAREYLGLAKSKGLPLSYVGELKDAEKSAFLKDLSALEAKVKEAGEPLSREELMGLLKKGAEGKLLFRTMLADVKELPLEAKDLKTIVDTDPALFESLLPKFAVNPKALAEFARKYVVEKIDMGALKKAVNELKSKPGELSGEALRKIGEILSKAIPGYRVLSASAVTAILTFATPVLAAEKGLGTALHEVAQFLGHSAVELLGDKAKTIVQAGEAGLLVWVIYEGVQIYRGVRSARAVRFNVERFRQFAGQLNGRFNRYAGMIRPGRDLAADLLARNTEITNDSNGMNDALAEINVINGFYKGTSLAQQRQAPQQTVLPPADIVALRNRLQQLGIADPIINNIFLDGDGNPGSPATVRGEIDGVLANRLREIANDFGYPDASTATALLNGLTGEAEALRRESLILEAIGRWGIDPGTGLPEIFETEAGLLTTLRAQLDEFINTVNTRVRAYGEANPRSADRERIQGEISEQLNELRSRVNNVTAAADRLARDIRDVSNIDTLLEIANGLHPGRRGGAGGRRRRGANENLGNAIAEAAQRRLQASRQTLETSITELLGYVENMGNPISGLSRPGIWQSIPKNHLWNMVKGVLYAYLGYTIFLEEDTEQDQADEEAEEDADAENEEEEEKQDAEHAAEEAAAIAAATGGNVDEEVSKATAEKISATASARSTISSVKAYLEQADRSREALGKSDKARATRVDAKIAEIRAALDELESLLSDSGSSTDDIKAKTAILSGKKKELEDIFAEKSPASAGTTEEGGTVLDKQVSPSSATTTSPVKHFKRPNMPE